MVWVLPVKVKETLLGWHGSFVRKNQLKVWKVAPLCIFWSVRKERNNIDFENRDLSIQRLKKSFACRLWNWFKGSLM